MKSRICLAVYFACWPASFGHSGLVLLPAGPWQATQSAAFASPAAGSAASALNETVVHSRTVVRHCFKAGSSG